MVFLSDSDAEFIRRFTEIQLETLQIEFRVQCREMKKAADDIIENIGGNMAEEDRRILELKTRKAAAQNIDGLERHKNDIESAYRHILSVVKNTCD